MKKILGLVIALLLACNAYSNSIISSDQQHNLEINAKKLGITNIRPVDSSGNTPGASLTTAFSPSDFTGTSISAAQLGISLPMTLTSGALSYITFTVATDSIQRMFIYIHLYEDLPNSPGNSSRFSALACDATGTPLLGANLTPQQLVNATINGFTETRFGSTQALQVTPCESMIEFWLTKSIFSPPVRTQYVRISQTNGNGNTGGNGAGMDWSDTPMTMFVLANVSTNSTHWLIDNIIVYTTKH